MVREESAKALAPTVSCTRHDAWHHTSHRGDAKYKVPPRERGDAGQLDGQQQSGPRGH